MVLEEREMVRNLGALRKPGVRNVSSVLMSRIRRINPRWIEHDAVAAPEYHELLAQEHHPQDNRSEKCT